MDRRPTSVDTRRDRFDLAELGDDLGDPLLELVARPQIRADIPALGATRSQP